MQDKKNKQTATKIPTNQPNKQKTKPPNEWLHNYRIIINTPEHLKMFKMESTWIDRIFVKHIAGPKFFTRTESQKI